MGNEVLESESMRTVQEALVLLNTRWGKLKIEAQRHENCMCTSSTPRTNREERDHLVLKPVSMCYCFLGTCTYCQHSPVLPSGGYTRVC